MKKNKKIILLCVGIFLLVCLLVGGYVAWRLSQKEVSKKPNPDSAVVQDTKPGGETQENDDSSAKEYETVYEYYDNQSQTQAESYSSTAGGQRTVLNMTNYYFNEDDYENVKYAGGTDTRLQTFIRGMGTGFYHATEGWNTSAKTKALDEANLNEMNIESMRTWGESLTDSKNTGKRDAIGSMAHVSLPNSIMQDGATGTKVFATDNAIQLITNEWLQKISSANLREKNRIILIGNEYRAYNQNKSGKWTYSGYDEVTLTKFRNVWLKSRFGTIANLNATLGTNYASFDKVVPNETENKKLFYEFWLYQRATFKDVFGSVVSNVRNTYSDTKWGYAGICSSDDPLGNDLYLENMDYNTQNLYANWWKDMTGFSFQLDNLAAWNPEKPVVITETGFMNGLTIASQEKAARNYKQALNLFYMRPRVSGSYIYNYTVSNADYIFNNNTWGMVATDRTRYASFDAVSQVYTDFKYLDKFYQGASNTPLVAITNMTTDVHAGQMKLTNENVSKALYANGVPIAVVPSDDASRFDTLSQKKLIYNDVLTYQNPDGSEDVATSLANYMKKGGEIVRLNAEVPTPLYGKGSTFTASNMDSLKSKYSTNLTIEKRATTDYESVWKVLGSFIHNDFITGKVNVDKGKVNENAVRILEAKGSNTVQIADPTWDLQMQLVYNNGRLYLCVVNTGDTQIDKVDVTLGVNEGVLFNLNPRVLRADKNVSVSRPLRANVPSYVEDVNSSKITYGTITISDLNTYAYIDLGMAVLK